MVQTAMYVVLGVLITLLAILVTMPMIWRRAVRLTRKRVLAETPISYSEIQAEKDMVRAEMAIEQRRLEVTVDEQQNSLTANSFKIERLSKIIDERDGTIADREQAISGLQEDLEQQKQAYTDQAEQFAETRDILSDANVEITRLETDKAALEQDLMHLETGNSEQKVEIVAQMARMEAMREEIYEIQKQRKQEMDQRSEAESKLAQKNTDFERNKERLEKSEEKIDNLQAQLADKDSQIDTLNQRIERQRTNSESKEDDANTARLAEAEARRVEAESKIAGLTLQLERQQLMAEAGDNVETVIAELQEEKQRLTDQLANQTKKQQSLIKELAALRKERGIFSDDSTLSPKEHQLRDEIRNIAARMVEYVAAQDGDRSPIHDILKKPNRKSDNETGSPPSLEEEDPFSHVVSLADRIKTDAASIAEDEKLG